MWDELEDKIEVFKSADRTNLKHLLTSYKVNQGNMYMRGGSLWNPMF